MPESQGERAALVESLRQTQSLVCDKLYAHYKVKVLPRPFRLDQSVTPRYVRFPLDLVEGETLERLVKRESEISLMIGKPGCSVYRDDTDGAIWVSFPRRGAHYVKLLDYIDGLPGSDYKTALGAAVPRPEMPDETQPTPLFAALGVDLNGIPAMIDLASNRNPHILITGVSGSGKTMTQRCMAASIMALSRPSEVSLAFFDFRDNFNVFAPSAGGPFYKHVLHPAISDVREMTRYLAWLVQQMREREARRVQRPRIVLMVDELSSFLVHGGNIVEAYLMDITRRGRQTGIHLVLASHGGDKDNLGKLGSLLKFRVTLSQARASDSYVATTHGGANAHRLTPGGDMLIGPTGVRAQGFYVSNTDIRTILRHHEIGRPRVLGPQRADGLAKVLVSTNSAPQQVVVGRPKSDFVDSEIAAVLAYRAQHGVWPSSTAVSRGIAGQRMGIPRAKRLIEAAAEHEAQGSASGPTEGQDGQE